MALLATIDSSAALRPHALDASLAGGNWFVAPFTPFSDINGVLPWAQNVVWGENLVWGESALDAVTGGAL